MLWRPTSPARRPPGFIEPCLPTLADMVPSGPQWVHEIKHDGFRFICRREGNRIRVFSRRGTDYTDRVPRVVDTFARLAASSVTLDGEGFDFDRDGVTNFALLRAALGRHAGPSTSSSRRGVAGCNSLEPNFDLCIFLFHKDAIGHVEKGVWAGTRFCCTCSCPWQLSLVRSLSRSVVRVRPPWLSVSARADAQRVEAAKP
jgi:hypothetical protein